MSTDAPFPSDGDLQAIGAAVLDHAAMTVRLGHATPAETLDYMSCFELLGDDESAAPHIVRDFVAWAARREDVVPNAGDRLASWLVRCGWTSDTQTERTRRLDSPART